MTPQNSLFVSISQYGIAVLGLLSYTFDIIIVIDVGAAKIHVAIPLESMAERQKGRKAERQKGRKAERQEGRKAERQKGRKAERTHGWAQFWRYHNPPLPTLPHGCDALLKPYKEKIDHTQVENRQANQIIAKVWRADRPDRSDASPGMRPLIPNLVRAGAPFRYVLSTRLPCSL